MHKVDLGLAVDLEAPLGVSATWLDTGCSEVLQPSILGSSVKSSGVTGLLPSRMHLNCMRNLDEIMDLALVESILDTCIGGEYEELTK